MNWGYKILIVIIAFIVAMMSMVFVAFRQTNDMLDENYYEKEMNYQSLINAAQNLNVVTDSTLINQNDSFVIVNIPKILISNFEQGNISGTYKARLKWRNLSKDYYREQNLIIE